MPLTEAYAIFDMSPTETLTEASIEKRSVFLIQNLTKRKERAVGTLVEWLEEIIADVIRAREILVTHCRGDCHMAEALLTTPTQITDVILTSFPLAHVTVVEREGRPLLSLNIMDRMAPIEISSSVLREPFVEAVQSLYRDVVIERSVSPRSAAIDATRFTTDVPLGGVHHFMRRQLRERGDSLSDAIFSYLGQERNRGELTSLGLAPEQLTEGADEDAMAIFMEVYNRIDAMQNGAEIYVEALERLYPAVFQSILQILAAQELEGADDGESGPIVHIAQQLEQRVIGQDIAIRATAGTLHNHEIGGDRNANFLFVGPTGVGKTELAKAVAHFKGRDLLFFAMNQFPGENDVSRFFGSSSGFVGSTDLPHIAKELNRRCNPQLVEEGETEKQYQVQGAIILFDELEKSHSKLKQSILTLLDEGKCTVYYTNDRKNMRIEYSFVSTIFIATSNLYQAQISHAIRNRESIRTIQEGFERLNQTHPTQSSYSPELLGRFEIIPFGPIPRGAPYQRLLELAFTRWLEEITVRIECRGIEIENRGQLWAVLENHLYGEGIDIRKVKNGFLANLENALLGNLYRLRPIQTKRLTIVCDDRSRPCFRSETYIPRMRRYTATPGAPIIFPGFEGE
jgi:hypothetical protein